MKIFNKSVSVICLAVALFFYGRFIFAAEVVIRLPYAKSESFTVVQGYNTLPTHINKDSYALDLTENECGAYGKDALATISGKVVLVKQYDDKSYGAQVLVESSGGLLTRYAHLIKNSIVVNVGDNVEVGQSVGKIGNTGLVSGTSCPRISRHPSSLRDV